MVVFSIFFKRKISKSIVIFFIFLFFILFIGLRYRVGGDWGAYLSHYQDITFDNILLQLFMWDPAYVLVEYISKFLGFDIWGVNSICAIIFLWGFLYFIKSFNLKLSYSFLIAYPYLIMVVVNGYTRQGVAIGLVMAFFALLYQEKLIKSLWILLLATLFHKTAIISGIILVFYKRRFDLKNMIIVLLFAIMSIGIYIIFYSRFEIFMRVYFEQQMQSSGGIIRILVNVLATILLFVFAKRWKFIYNDYDLWKIAGYFSFAMLFVAIYFKATTVADRLLLYFYPLQIVVFQRVLFLIKDKSLKYFYFYNLILLYGGILIVWLLFATHRFSWIPYDNYFLR